MSRDQQNSDATIFQDLEKCYLAYCGIVNKLEQNKQQLMAHDVVIYFNAMLFNCMKYYKLSDDMRNDIFDIALMRDKNLKVVEYAKSNMKDSRNKEIIAKFIKDANDAISFRQIADNCDAQNLQIKLMLYMCSDNNKYRIEKLLLEKFATTFEQMYYKIGVLNMSQSGKHNDHQYNEIYKCFS